MSERTAPSIARLDVLLPLLRALPASSDQQGLVEDADALRRSIAAFHMEAIRFRMHRVDRALRRVGDDPACRRAFDELRETLEAAGFHTGSHSAP